MSIRFPTNFRFKLTIALIVSGSWLFLALLLLESRMEILQAEIAWSALSALIALWALNALEYFQFYYPIPSPDSVLTLMITLPLAAIAARYAAGLLFQVQTIRLREIALATPILAAFVYGFQAAVGYLFIYSGAKRRIYLAVSRDEAARILRNLRLRRLTRFYEPILVDHLTDSIRYEESAFLVISRSELAGFGNHEILIRAMLAGMQIVDYRELIAQLSEHLDLETLDLWMFLKGSIRRSTFSRGYALAKKFLEPLFAGLLLLLLLPFFILVAVGVKLTSRGPIFYGQTRLGLSGKPFSLWKFRSMVAHAEQSGHQWSKRFDDRVTPFGTFLRKSRLDELPQLLNVIRGEMSFIGPRPERPEFYAELAKQIPIFRVRLLVLPGITGWAQTLGGYAATIRQHRRKLEYDLYYMQRISPKLDFIILVRTFKTLFGARR